MIERRAGAGDERGLVDQCFQAVSPSSSSSFGSSAASTLTGARVRRAPCARSSMHAAVLQIVDAAEAIAAADRPVHRHGVDTEHALDLVEQIERIAAGQVELVDEGEDRQVAQRQTSNSLRVCGSMPLAASITITALSTASSVR